MKYTWHIKLILVILILPFNEILHSQTLSPQSVNSAAVSFNQPNGQLSFTIGELVVLSSIDSNGNQLGSGFTNSAVISVVNTTPLSVAEVSNVQVELFPNPTTDLLTLSIKSEKLGDFCIEIFDAQGKIIANDNYSSLAKSIGVNTSNWSAGIYFLIMKEVKGTTLANFKIVKN
jgi:hypothetical protein